MKLWIRGVLFSLAIFLTVAVAPVSRWVLLNQADLIFRGSLDSTDAPGLVDVFLPDWTFKPETYSSSSPDAQFMKAVCQKGSARLRALWIYTASHPQQINGWAVQARYTGIIGTHFPDQGRVNSQTKVDELERSNVLEHGLQACRRAEALEPGNAYFSILGATYSAELGSSKTLASELDALAKSTFYQNHLRDQEQAMNRAVVEAKGYRGEVIHVGVDSAILLPDYAHIKALSKYLNRSGTLRQKLQMLTGVKWMSVDEDTGIGVLVAVSTGAILVRPDVVADRQTYDQLDDAKRLQWAADFDRRVARAGLVEMAGTAEGLCQTQLKLRDAAAKVFAAPNLFNSLLPSMSSEGPDGPDEMQVPIDLLAPFVLIFTIVFCGVLSWVGSYLGRPWPNPTSKFKPWLACFPMVLTLWAMNATRTGLPASGGLITLTVILFGVILASSLGLGNSNRPKNFQEAGKWISACTSVLLCIAAGIFAAGYALQAKLGWALLVGGGIVFCASMLFGRQKKDFYFSLGGAGMILFSTCYLVFVGRQIVDNREELLARQQFTDEGDRIRNLAGLSR